MAVSCPNIFGSFLLGVFAMLREMELHHLSYRHSRRFAELRAKVMVRIEKLDRGKDVEWGTVEIKAKGRALLSLGCSSYLQAAQVLESGMGAAVLPDNALSTLKPDRFHRLPIPDRYTLCLAWSARNADTRPALAGLIQQLTEKMVIVV